MKKLLWSLAVLGLIGSLPVSVQATPSNDLKEYREFFQKKFPAVKFEEYSNGIYALPGAEDRRAEWEAIMEFPPYELELEKGRKFWKENKLGSCFRKGGKGVAANYPYWNGKEIRTIELDINDCLKKNGKKPIEDLKKGTMAQVVAYMKSLSRGVPVRINLDSQGAIDAYNKGKQFYWARRGQLNFSCANCHVQNAGKFIAGNILSAGLGHGVGFPAYRSKWGGLGTLHRRYGGCNNNIRAKSLKPQSEEYRALELYETYLSNGLPLTAPSQRF
ncbi:MAG: sulfur oxidation c-type cytochrome SoxA [Gammaproteobacteria bacterium]|nr:sulfur oxidation c-type cytochrome SoxA [Gammaproteobacteria bacterium]